MVFASTYANYCIHFYKSLPLLTRKLYVGGHDDENESKLFLLSSYAHTITVHTVCPNFIYEAKTIQRAKERESVCGDTTTTPADSALVPTITATTAGSTDD